MILHIKTVDRICLVAVIAVFLLSGYWVVSRNVRQLRQVRQESEFLSRSVKNLGVAHMNLQRLNVAIANTKKQVKLLRDRIPGSAEIGQFLKQLDMLMKKRRIVLESLQPLPSMKEKLFTRIPVHLISRGSFVNIYQFLHDLETMNRLVHVKNINITRTDNNSACRFEVTASVFEL